MSETIEELQARYPGAVTFKFGDSEALCQELVSLVRAGKKTATCGNAAEFGPDGEPAPEPGRCDILLKWDGTPAMVIETQSVEFKRFCDMDEGFSLAEGENETLDGWRADHQAYFERNGGFDPEMMLICERFRVVEDLE